jgi:small conductance mechanosensitive channel
MQQEEIPVEQLESAVLAAAVPILLIITGALLILRFARPLIRRLLRRLFENQKLYGARDELTVPEIQKRVNTIETLAVSILRFVVVILVCALVLAVLHLGELVAGLGLVIAALTFATQDYVRDYFAGMFIVIENQFFVGDVIRVAGITGTVEDFSLRRTMLRDSHGTLHIISNGEIRVASNLTRGYAGINLDVPISYETDVDRAISLIKEVAGRLAEDPTWAGRILKAPEAVRVGAFGDLGMSITVLGKVRAGDQWAVTGELRRRILAALASAGITLPQRNVFVERAVEHAP